jgi:protein gp37
MGEITGISWCDHTFNPWIGCQKISAGCLNCYAARDNARYQWVPEWGRDYRLTSDTNWKNPIKWAKQAVKDGVTRRVFCASLADVFDANVDWQWRARLFQLINDTEKIGGLEWLLLTKRPENISRIHMIETFKNIRIGVTCENQEMANKRIPILLNSWKGKNFISIEPMLSPVNLTQIKWAKIPIDPKNYTALGVPAPDEMWSLRNALLSRPGDELNKPLIGVGWVICGSESMSHMKPGRHCNIEWIRNLRDQCEAAHVPFFLNQMEVDGKLTKEPYLDGRQWLEFPKEAK